MKTIGLVFAFIAAFGGLELLCAWVAHRCIQRRLRGMADEARRKGGG